MRRMCRASELYAVVCCLLPAVWYGVAGMNTTAIINSILNGYDNRLRPDDTDDEEGDAVLEVGGKPQGNLLGGNPRGLQVTQSIHAPKSKPGRKRREVRKEQLRQPDRPGPPVKVKIVIYVESMEGIRESTMDFSITMYLRMFWHDSRLAYTGNRSISFKGSDMRGLWTPDLVFLYEKQSKVHTVTQVNSLLRVDPVGNISYSSRVSATLACNMQLHRFPMDSQKCSIVMSSYAYSTRDVILYVENNSIQVEPGITISKFRLLREEIENDQVPYLLGNYSTPKCHFYFMRQVESFFLTVYIPTVLLVSIAWLSFWIDAKAAPARVALGITTVLTVTTMTAGLQETLPVVTYAKAIDIWLAVCLLFVFFSLLEYGMANYLLVVQMRLQRKEEGADLEQTPNKRFDQQTDGDNNTVHDGDDCRPRWCRKRVWTAHRLDCLARLAYPLAFIAFNVAYWVSYLVF